MIITNPLLLRPLKKDLSWYFLSSLSMPPIANKEWQALCVHFFQFMTFQRSCAAICGYVLCMYVVNSSNVIILFRVIKRQFCYVMMTTASLKVFLYKKIHSRLRCQDTMEDPPTYLSTGCPIWIGPILDLDRNCGYFSLVGLKAPKKKL